MRWLRRLWPEPPPESEAEEAEEPEDTEETGPPAVERAAPGIAALFHELEPDGTHAVLDLGPAARTHLDIYSRYARRIRFADLLGAPARGENWATALQALPSGARELFDVVLAWDLLDRMSPEEHPLLVERLAGLTSEGALLHILVNASPDRPPRPVRFTLQSLERIRHEPEAHPWPTWPPLLPAEVERVLEPFHVIHAFTLRLGYRAYVAVRREEE